MQHRTDCYWQFDLLPKLRELYDWFDSAPRGRKFFAGKVATDLLITALDPHKTDADAGEHLHMAADTIKDKLK